MPADDELLRQYRAGSETAFAGLVARHVDWVHAAARRRVRDDHAADDVTQAVFVALALYAKRGPEVDMTAWMFGVLRRAAANVLRSATRRKKHERLAARAVDDASPVDADDDEWAAIAATLDDAVAKLPAHDRRAVLLRFYHRRSHASVGESLGLTEEGARKRVARAVARLRRSFARAGVATHDDLAASLFDRTAPASPPGAATAIASAALTNASNLGSTVTSLARVSARPTIGGHALAAFAVAMFVLLVAMALPLGRASRPPALVSPLATTTPFATTTAAPTEAATRPATLTFADVIAGIRANEVRIRNLHVVGFHTTRSVRGPNDAEWTLTPETSAGDAWFDATPGGQMRIDFEEQISAWIGGTGPYAASRSIQSWDGTEGRDIHLASGVPGKLQPDPVAMVTPTPPPWLWPMSRYETGLAFTNQYFIGSGENEMPPRPRIGLSAQFQAAVGKREPQIAMQTINGFDAIRLQWTSPFGTLTWWFDPSHDFSLVGRRETIAMPNTHRDESLEVFKLEEAAKGVWFPKSARATLDDPITPAGKPRPAGSQRRYGFRATRTIANDPAFDAQAFLPEIPAGYSISDVRGKRRDYIRWRDGTEHEMKAGEPVPFDPAGP